MLGKIIFKNGECTTVDTIHSAQLYEGEEVRLHGHLLTYIITKNGAIFQSEKVTKSLRAVRFRSTEDYDFRFIDGVVNEFATRKFYDLVVFGYTL